MIRKKKRFASRRRDQQRCETGWLIEWCSWFPDSSPSIIPEQHLGLSLVLWSYVFSSVRVVCWEDAALFASLRGVAEAPGINSSRWFGGSQNAKTRLAGLSLSREECIKRERTYSNNNSSGLYSVLSTPAGQYSGSNPSHRSICPSGDQAQSVLHTEDSVRRDQNRLKTINSTRIRVIILASLITIITLCTKAYQVVLLLLLLGSPPKKTPNR